MPLDTRPSSPATREARDASSSGESALDLRVAVVGAGPAGIYAGALLEEAVRARGGRAAIDLLDSLPAPFGLIRYGVAPDHPRIKGIVTSLHEMLDTGALRFLGNVEVGRDVSIAELQERYDAVILATGAVRDAPLPIPGIDLPGSFGAADFVSWFDGHPDVPRDWPLDAAEVAVLGNGNVALDVARILAKHAIDLRTTEVPDSVLGALETSAVTDVHVVGRRGPLDVKFTPIELRELGEVPDVDIVLADEDFEGLALAAGSSNQLKVILRIFEGWRRRGLTGASRRLHLHFHLAPVEVLGERSVEGLRFERTAAAPGGGVVGTGEFRELTVQAVYRAVGYRGSALPGAPFDPVRGVVPNDAGRVLVDGSPVHGVYATGWIKRGPVGLIGHTKSDAKETVGHLVDDALAGRLAGRRDSGDLVELLESRGTTVATWAGWLALDAHERSLGETHRHRRERVKVVPRDEQVRHSRSPETVDA